VSQIGTAYSEEEEEEEEMSTTVTVTTAPAAVIGPKLPQPSAVRVFRKPIPIKKPIVKKKESSSSSDDDDDDDAANFGWGPVMVALYTYVQGSKFLEGIIEIEFSILIV